MSYQSLNWGDQVCRLRKKCGFFEYNEENMIAKESYINLTVRGYGLVLCP